MKLLKRTIPALFAVMILFTSAGCKKDKNSGLSHSPNIGGKVIKVEMMQEADANDTVFSLNSVIDAGAQTEEGDHYIYLDVTIRNKTKKGYSLSTLNNFYLILPDGTEVPGHIRTQLYATNNFSEKYFGSPFDIPPSGEFKGVIGGFVLPENQKEFTVGFFPTKDDLTPYAKETVIKIDVSPTQIVSVPSDLKKN